MSADESDRAVEQTRRRERPGSSATRSRRRAPRASASPPRASRAGVAAVETARKTTSAPSSASASESAASIPACLARRRACGSTSNPRARRPRASEPPIKPRPATAMRVTAAAAGAPGPRRPRRPPRAGPIRAQLPGAAQEDVPDLGGWSVGVPEQEDPHAVGRATPARGSPACRAAARRTSRRSPSRPRPGTPRRGLRSTVKTALATSSGRMPFSAIRRASSSSVRASDRARLVGTDRGGAAYSPHSGTLAEGHRPRATFRKTDVG